MQISSIGAAKIGTGLWGEKTLHNSIMRPFQGRVDYHLLSVLWSVVLQASSRTSVVEVLDHPGHWCQYDDDGDDDDE